MKGSYLIFLLLLVILPAIRRRRIAITIIRTILSKKMQNKENHVMKELAKRFIGEDCIIYPINSFDGSLHGVIKEVNDRAMIIENTSGELEVVNLDFVTRIRQYPRKKNGKKKGLVLD